MATLSREATEAEEAANLAKAEYEAVAARVDAEMGRFQVTSRLIALDCT